MVSGFKDCVTFVSAGNVSVEASLLALRALLCVDDLPASRRREPSEERTNLHRFGGIFQSLRRRGELIFCFGKYFLFIYVNK